ncbi:MAG: quinoprotein dehydrogenase-associated putative ABC transporter substrate-binding protein [Altererythrobacter sp.]|nr:quinoprotein dehydrogenase-associated putative ABC transporter substrate-binding protein [Altererythrobacter sp.]OJU61077.1 MAG: amino acid ABC transporter substrate-binding protein [Altererythrobacter sp. 66-12]
MKPLAAFALLAALLSACAPKPLKVCVDPNNLPFSNRAGQGFENKLAELIAADLHRPVDYVWWAQRRGFVRNTVGEGACDIWPGVASGLETLATTRPYYRSSYMFVTRQADALSGLTLDDPRLKALSIGVQLVGDDGGNTPPSHALARRGLIDNVHGYMLYGDYTRPNPPAAIMRAVEQGDIDAGLVWGPLAGYFAKESAVPLRLEPVTPWLDDNQWPMAYDISVGVRKDDPELLTQVGRALTDNRAKIERLLAEYGVTPGGS